MIQLDYIRVVWVWSVLDGRSPRRTRLSDLVSVGLLTRVFPPGVVDEVIAECGRTEQRHRSLPARVMAYFSIGLALILRALTTMCWGC